MGIRYQKRINIIGNLVRLNISKTGVGVSAGVRGARISKGPGGTYISVGIPGSGLYYRKRIGGASGKWADFFGGGKRNQKEKAVSASAAGGASATLVDRPKPGFFAPATEKSFARGVTAYFQKDREAALHELLAVADEEPGAAILAASILAHSENTLDQARAIHFLESIVQQEEGDFPSELMQKYLPNDTLNIDITPDVAATVPLDGLAAVLLLVELYQSNDRFDDAIALLEEVDDMADEPVVTLSLCELYSVVEFWDGIIERTDQLDAPTDDVTLETLIYAGQAWLGKEMPDAARAVLTKALRRQKGLSPQLHQAGRYWRALAYIQSGKKSRGREELEKVYAAAPEWRPAVEEALAALGD
jgi:tetratricopeptide (TPR) repeat protein